MDKQLSKYENEIRTIEQSFKWIFPIFVILVLVSPVIFTRNLGLIDFTQSGQIGDTIGGITAPLIGLLSSILIFLSFKAQLRANKIQMEALLDERKRIDEENNIKFIESLLSDLRHSETDRALKDSFSNINSLFGELILIWTHANNRGEINKKYKQETDKRQHSFSILMKYLSIMIILKSKLEENNYKKNKQIEYIKLSYKYIYLQVFSQSFENLLNSYNNFFKINEYELPNEVVFLVENNIIPLKEYFAGIK